jgi:hypothetical protein
MAIRMHGFHKKQMHCLVWKLFFSREDPRCRRYGRTAALRLLLQPKDEDYIFVLFLVMEHRWNETDREEPKNSGGKPVPVPLCPPQIPHGPTPVSNPGLRRGKSAAKRLSHGRALVWKLIQMVVNGDLSVG